MERKGDKKKFAMKYVKKETCVAMCAVKNVIEEVDLLRSLDHPFISSIWYTFQVLEAMEESSLTFSSGTGVPVGVDIL